MGTKERDIRAFLFFPYHQVVVSQGLAEPLFKADPEGSYSDLVLFVRKSLVESPKEGRLLAVAIRNAWMALRENPHLVQHLSKHIVHSRDYMTSVMRFSGLFSEPSFEGPNVGDFWAADAGFGGIERPAG